ncbi:MAG: hypothetical protein EAZ85_03845 [Bacteroidetes bacterium]|nr:MAG: hypothetical protein EAZ85_03845 [Bacteroidota bacterium]
MYVFVKYFIVFLLFFILINNFVLQKKSKQYLKSICEFKIFWWLLINAKKIFFIYQKKQEVIILFCIFRHILNF